MAYVGPLTAFGACLILARGILLTQQAPKDRMQLPVPTGSDSSKELTEMQAAFVEAFVTNGGNKEEAAIEAGYSEHTARVQAYDLLRKPHVMQAIVERSMSELIASAPKAVQRLHSLTQARSEYVALQASQDILNRLGIKAPDRQDIRLQGDIQVNIDLG